MTRETSARRIYEIRRGVKVVARDLRGAPSAHSIKDRNAALGHLIHIVSPFPPDPLKTGSRMTTWRTTGGGEDPQPDVDGSAGLRAVGAR